MAGPSSSYSEASTISEALQNQLIDIANYAVLLQGAHWLLFGVGLIATYSLGRLRQKFKQEVHTDAVVESETYLEPTGVYNFESHKEFQSQVIHTVETFKLRKIFEEATLGTDLLTKITKQAAKLCTDEKPIVWQHLHEAMKSKNKLVKAMPERLARRFGHYSKDERKLIVNEIARCWRNYRSEQLTPKEQIRNLEFEDRQAIEWAIDITMLMFQEGAGADVFTTVRMRPDIMRRELPAREDTKFMYHDPDNLITDPASHLHERRNAIGAIRDAIIDDLASENPVLDKFAARKAVRDEWGRIKIRRISNPPPMPSTPASDFIAA